ncbi:flavin reductase family protein [Amycolatopsis sacchari]|uniref:NADH-FMN oxidoreductase RutF, flavin reductase (DIM6/NTAB) family n=1 Tax=Amycolatopsis sacchari TaxID=115433 RepID=A0A1I4BCE5_9PSEU|nr:flavin reductase family protein [Amycolatopsis sacchari]SFK65631.1 NADH-FMN oxidoreductase RutF, flavin reductase (DIM6/NTAB) family [Amycolatopsis sacchari]
MLTIVDEGTSRQVLRQAYGHFPSGVAAVCALLDGGPVGMAVSSFTSVSLAPPLVSICADNGSTTWPRLRTASHLGVTILGAGHEDACRQLAAKQGDRFAGFTVHTTSNGAVFLDGAAAWLDCELDSEIPAGDHRIALLRVRAFQTETGNAPLVFHRSAFRRLSGT